ncbi:MAG TPA: 2-isopropylmalate synthase, partial [Terriglobales bacterium]|nr:2-isopropylmalate synthase [Terriglobales bacterium]
GFPISSEGDYNAVRQVAAEVRGCRIAALARCNPTDVLRAARALEPAARPRIHTFLATSDIHLQFKLKITRQQALEQAAKAVALARSWCDDVEFSPEDATRSDVEYLCRVIEAVVEAGATTINIPDTVGYAVPREFSRLIETIRARVKVIEKAAISVHCHNDLGLAVANSLAAVEAGAAQVECTINGIGERAGNAALEELIMAMHVRPDAMPYATRVNTAELWPTSRMLSEIISFSPQPNKAIVGSNAFAHEAGIHQHGVLSNPLCYEIMTPESVGAPGNRIVLGKHSGRHALANRCAQLGWPVSGERLNEVYAQFIELADRKKNIYEQDLLAILGAAKIPTAEAPIARAQSASGD